MLKGSSESEFVGCDQKWKGYRGIHRYTFIKYRLASRLGKKIHQLLWKLSPFLTSFFFFCGGGGGVQNTWFQVILSYLFPGYISLKHAWNPLKNYLFLRAISLGKCMESFSDVGYKVWYIAYISQGFLLHPLPPNHNTVFLPPPHQYTHKHIPCHLALDPHIISTKK